MKCYVKNKDVPTEKWLTEKIKSSLPEKSNEEIQKITSEIVDTINLNDEKKESLNTAVANGRSKESWFASEVKKATAAMSAKETVEYLKNLDNAVNTANEALYRTIITQSGNVSQNPCLDGFIAEQYHAQTFNMNAEAAGSQYRAKVLEPQNGNGYTKNSVDIVIVDGNGKTIRRYQSKYCDNSKATANAFEKGDYRGQRKLVPEGQGEGIPKKTVSVIESPDGVKSNPLSKARAEQMRDEAQSGNWNDLNWNEYKTKDIAVGIGKQAGYAAFQGAAIGVGFDIAQKLYNGEEIKGEEVIETALTVGADSGVKAAAAGALKVGIEKNIIKFIPKAAAKTNVLTGISCTAIENVKVLKKMATGELSAREGFEKMGQTTVATIAGCMGGAKGAAFGASIGALLGPVGAAVGGFIGGTAGYIASSKVGETVTKCVQKVGREIRETAKSIGGTAKDFVKRGWETLKSGGGAIVRGVKNLFSW